MSGMWRFVALLIAIALAIGVGAGIYNAGVSAGFAEAARQAAESGEVVAGPYGWGGPYWHGGWGFGSFAVIFWILGILLIIGVVRAAVGWGRWGGPGSGAGGWGDRRDRVEALHRELHRREGGDEPRQPAGA